MKITIYQIIPELDQDRLIFMPLSYFQKAGYPSPPAEIYESVFCGETEVATLEEIPCQSLTFWKYSTHREKAVSISVIHLVFLK